MRVMKEAGLTEKQMKQQTRREFLNSAGLTMPSAALSVLPRGLGIGSTESKRRGSWFLGLC
jgi:hypothetical protein